MIGVYQKKRQKYNRLYIINFIKTSSNIKLLYYLNYEDKTSILLEHRKIN